MARGMVKDEIKIIWDEVVVSHKQENSVTVSKIAVDSMQALPSTSVELRQHYLFLLKSPVRYCPFMYYTESLL
jgi:hypothetical protein